MLLKNIIEKNEQQMVKDLIEFINIPSVIDEGEGGYPFGSGIDDALKWSLEQFNKVGLKTYYDPEGFYGYAEMGEGEELIGILAHVDVVPGGSIEHWTTSPFKGHVSGGKIYGRGAIDDKGPIVSIIYAVKALVESQMSIHKRIRVIFGTDEENHWRGICRYMAKEEVPHYGFTPDSVFPVVYAEKGLLQIRLKSSRKSEVNVKGGKAMNSVPEVATYRGNHIHKIEKQLKKLGFDHEIENDELFVIGKTAHSAKPQSGINAIARMALAMKNSDVSSPTIDFLSEKVGLTFNGELIFGNCEDEPSGKLTFSVNQIDLSAYGENIGIDIRFPVTVDKKFILDGIRRAAEKYKLTLEELDYLPPIFMPSDHPLIKALMEVYEVETGLDASPVSTGGATYARAMKNCVAFGPLFPGQEKVAHFADEYIEIKALVKCAQIYAKAIEKLLNR